MKLVVLASYRGSNFNAIAEAVKTGKIPYSELVGLICNREGAPVLELAKRHQVPAHLISSKAFPNREEYEDKLLALLQSLHPDFVCLAGYLLLLGPSIVRAFPSKILNIHPSLLPAFRGLSAVKQALAAGVKRAGCTVHFVTEAMDEGPILAQKEVPVMPGDNEETLSARILQAEHHTYVKVLERLAKDSLIQPKTQ